MRNIKDTAGDVERALRPVGESPTREREKIAKLAAELQRVIAADLRLQTSDERFTHVIKGLPCWDGSPDDLTRIRLLAKEAFAILEADLNRDGPLNI